MAQELGGPVQLEFIAQLHCFYARLLTLAVPTVCAIQGHCFAGGWLLALCCDYRVMTAERGAACMTEVDFGATLTPPLTALIKEKLSRRLSARMMLEACRLGAPELAAEGAVDAAVPLARLLPVAEVLARKAAKGGASATYGAIKEDMYSDAVRALRHGPVARSAL
jgi:enoyl-CoA hydratase/carnithine racemase